MPRQAGVASGTSLVTTAETVIAILPPITLQASNPVDLLLMADITSGTGVTGVTFTVRRGSTLTGASIGAFGPYALAASTRMLYCLSVRDTQAVDVSGQQYVLDVTQVGATGNGTTGVCTIRADF